ncbi:MAG: HipA N-terminal domain-containing protein [Bacteroidota bacterium]
MRKGNVWVNDLLAGTLVEDEEGYHFSYSETYLSHAEPKPVSLSLPLNASPYHSRVLFSFFDGLIPEGWLLMVAQKSWKIDPRDRMGLLLSVCRDCVGNIRIEPVDA